MDTSISLGRLEKLFLADEIAEDICLEREQRASTSAMDVTPRFVATGVLPDMSSSSLKSSSIDKSSGPQLDIRDLSLPIVPGRINFEDASFSWDKEPVLRDISITIPQGSLCVIIGPVGAGKSTLLEALTGSVTLLSGSVTIEGSTSYVGQQVKACIRAREIKRALE